MFENIEIVVGEVNFPYEEGSWDGKEPRKLISTTTSITGDGYDIDIIWEDSESMGSVYILDLIVESGDEWLWIEESCGITSEFGEFDWPLWRYCSHPHCHHELLEDNPYCEEHSLS